MQMLPSLLKINICMNPSICVEYVGVKIFYITVPKSMPLTREFHILKAVRIACLFILSEAGFHICMGLKECVCLCAFDLYRMQKFRIVHLDQTVSVGCRLTLGNWGKR